MLPHNSGDIKKPKQRKLLPELLEVEISGRVIKDLERFCKQGYKVDAVVEIAIEQFLKGKV